MQTTARLSYLRIAPRKVRLLADLIRGKSVESAQSILSFVANKAAEPLLKLLKSAAANAKTNFQLDPSNLYISEITVDEGQKYKRWRARARGQAYEIQKKTSHIIVVLDETGGAKKAGKVKIIKETGEIKEGTKKESEIKKVKLKPETEIKKPKIEKGVRRIFKRKAF